MSQDQPIPARLTIDNALQVGDFVGKCLKRGWAGKDIAAQLEAQLFAKNHAAVIVFVCSAAVDSFRMAKP